MGKDAICEKSCAFQIDNRVLTLTNVGYSHYCTKLKKFHREIIKVFYFIPV